MYLRFNKNPEHNVEVNEYHIQHALNEDGKQHVAVYLTKISDVEILENFSRSYPTITSLELLEVDGDRVRSISLTNGKLNDLYERYNPGYDIEYVAIIVADAIETDRTGMM